MSALLPMLMLAGAAVALAAIVLALWRSLRAAFGAAAEDAGPLDVLALSPERARLVEEKESLLRSLADLAFDREAGKISDADAQALERRLRASVASALRRLDEELGDARGEARALLVERMAKVPRPDAPGASASAVASPADTRVTEGDPPPTDGGGA